MIKHHPITGYDASSVELFCKEYFVNIYSRVCLFSLVFPCWSAHISHKDERFNLQEAIIPLLPSMVDLISGDLCRVKKTWNHSTKYVHPLQDLREVIVWSTRMITTIGILRDKNDQKKMHVVLSLTYPFLSSITSERYIGPFATNLCLVVFSSVLHVWTYSKTPLLR